jgi:hypothetical protein
MGNGVGVWDESESALKLSSMIVESIVWWWGMLLGRGGAGGMCKLWVGTLKLLPPRLMERP